jgi:hypothetical protein
LLACVSEFSLRLCGSKRIGCFWSVRVGLHYRALAVQHEAGIAWFWVGPPAEHYRLAGRNLSYRKAEPG